MLTAPASRAGHQARPTAMSLAFLAWMLAGATLVLGVLSLFTIGIFVLPGALALAVGLAVSRRGHDRAATGLISGAGLMPLYVAYQNRGGPGNVCVTTATSQSCVSEWSPWPWLAAGLTLILAGLALFAVLSRRASDAGGQDGGAGGAPGRG